MRTEKTELEWAYEPRDFFEVQYRTETGEYVLVADGGVLRVTLLKPRDPIDDGLPSRITREVEGLFRLRQLQVHRPFKVGTATIYQRHSDGTKSIFLSVGEVLALRANVGQVDIVVRDSSGVVVQDSKADRIKKHTKLIDSLMPKLSSSASLSVLLESYDAAVNDPANELMHLYEIREALAKLFGGDADARQRLQVKEDWKRLGYLANEAPLKEGRHRGKHSKLRHASAAELEEARRIARQLIEAFANQL
jgi:hypothetical protein